MKIREHIWLLDRCMVCRLPRSLSADSACEEREDYQVATAREPSIRPIACEDQHIAARLVELYDAKTAAMNAAPKE